MIKYFTYNSHDEYGQHIIPVNSNQDLVKTASSNYSEEIAEVIQSMDKKPELYYVVINALGSYEVWGVNGNGDAFPRSGLKHLSLRSDLGTTNDYGYKTFEYYAKLFKHHVNKPNSPSYGEVVFSHWNPKMDRVELIVGIDRFRAPDIVSALDNGENVAVSMGAKVRYDECSICGNKARTRAQYCKHAKGYLGKIIDEDTAEQWSLELGKEILPGTKVHAINEFPRFFDISKVHVGADRTAFVLGKAASDGDITYAVDLADAYGVTDEMFDKAAALSKSGEIKKIIPSNGFDGEMARITKNKLMSKLLQDRAASAVENEPEINSDFLDSAAKTNGIGAIVSGMLNAGIFPKPREFQRIALVRSGHRRLADELDSRGMIFNHRGCGRSMHFDGDSFNAPHITSALKSVMPERSFLPGLAAPRMTITIMIKKAGVNPTIVNELDKIAEMYKGVKDYAKGITMSKIAKVSDASLMRELVGVAAYLNIIDTLRGDGGRSISDIPASDFEDVLVDTNFSGMLDYGRSKTAGQILDSVTVPGALINASSDQNVLYYSKGDTVDDWMSKSASDQLVTQSVINDLEKLSF